MPTKGKGGPLLESPPMPKITGAVQWKGILWAVETSKVDQGQTPCDKTPVSTRFSIGRTSALVE